MAGRKAKKGLDYFPMDIDVFGDIKIRKLIRYQGGKAFAIYAYLLCNIYKEGYYSRWDNELPFVISEITGYDEAYISEVIKCCMTVGLFSRKMFDEHQVLTSKGIQERYADISQQANRVSKIEEFDLISSEEIPISSEEIPKPPEETPNKSESMQQSKVKESKSNQSKGKVANAAENKFSAPYQRVVDFWLKTLHPGWTFGAVQGKAVKSILKKAETMIRNAGNDTNDDVIATGVIAILSNLPPWFQGKELPVIDSKFNEIVTEIKNTRNGKSTVTATKRDSIFNPYAGINLADYSPGAGNAGR